MRKQEEIGVITQEKRELIRDAREQTAIILKKELGKRRLENELS